jgi:hypothetical protein
MAGRRIISQADAGGLTMIVSVKWAALKQTHGYEYVARFALGGLATVFAGVMPSSLVRNRRPVSGLPGHLLCQRHTR